MRNSYSLSEFIKIGYSFLITKITFRQARLIRRPVYMRGKASISGGKGLTIGYNCRFDLDGKKKTLFIGDHCEFGDMTHIVALEHVEIGNDVLIASKVFISDTNHGDFSKKYNENLSIPPKQRKLTMEKTCIGNNVWIGENVVILPGSMIGDGCIIGANTTVKGIIPDNSIAVGSPAKVIKRWNTKTDRWERC